MNFQRNKRWATNWHICIDHQLAKLCDANVRHVFATLHLIGVTFSITFPKLSLHTFSFWISFCCAHLSHNRMLPANICAYFGYSVFWRWFYLRSNFNILIRSIFLVTIVIDSWLLLNTRFMDRVYQIIEKVKLEWIPPFPLVNSQKNENFQKKSKKHCFQEINSGHCTSDMLLDWTLLFRFNHMNGFWCSKKFARKFYFYSAQFCFWMNAFEF